MGFKAGFKILGWPLTILLGVIDFIRGWMGADAGASILDKIKAGFQEAIAKFMELPAILLGGAVDWVMGLFGIDL